MALYMAFNGVPLYIRDKEINVQLHDNYRFLMSPLRNIPSYGGAWGGLHRQLTVNEAPLSPWTK